MLFPETERVIYTVNPLELVICQLRFPPILRIEAETPAGFQDRIRKEFPQFQERTEFAAILPPEVVQLLPQEVIQSLKPSHKVYDFASSDGSLVVSLASNFIALTSRNYERWEGFYDRLEIVLDALQEEYEPATFTRIGLRYRDLIKKRELGLADCSWPELLNEVLVREFATPELAGVTENIGHGMLLRLGPGQERVQIQHGLAMEPSTGEAIGYFIDSDFFVEEMIDVDAASNRLVEFNQQNRRLFRWCISDRLHDAMGPRPVE